MLIPNRIILATATMLTSVGVAIAQPVWPPPYAMIEIKAPGDTQVAPMGINGSAAMTGSLISPNISFVWEEGVGHYLRSVNPIFSADTNDINDAGWIVGVGGDFSGNFVPTLWIDREPISLGTLGGDGGEADAVNVIGVVVGQAANQEVPGRAFRWSDGKMIDLGTLGGRGAHAWGVNNLDHIVGHTFSDDPNLIGKRGFLWENGVMIDIGTLPGGSECQAFDINDLSQIVGHCRDADSNDIAFLWENGVMRSIHDFDLGDVSWAMRINNRSEVVGIVDPGIDAFIWNEVNGMRLIDDLIPPNHGLRIRIGRDINDYGQIALEAYRRNAQNGTFVGALVTPVNPTMTMEQPAPGRAGVSNTITVSGATPGVTVRFFYSPRGGGEIIPGCATRVNALQLSNPQLIGSARADANGVATITRNVPPVAQNQTILFQAVVQNECAISQLVVHRFE